MDFEKLSEEDTYALICLLLAKVKDPEFASFSETVNVLDQKNFENFITYFGGCTIKVPTIEEIRQVMRAIILYKLYVEDGFDFKRAMAKAGYKPNETLLAKKEYVYVKEKIEKANESITRKLEGPNAT